MAKNRKKQSVGKADDYFKKKKRLALEASLKKGNFLQCRNRTLNILLGRTLILRTLHTPAVGAATGLKNSNLLIL